MNTATSFPALIELTQAEQAAYVTFSSHKTGVFWREDGKGRLSAAAAFYRSDRAERWDMTDWIANTTDLDRPDEDFFPIDEAVEQQAHLERLVKDEA